jgi:hypothetical protein
MYRGRGAASLWSNPDHIVVSAIDFNDESLADTCEVCEERTDRMLPPKFQIGELFSS